MKSGKLTSRFIAQSAVIACLYAILCLIFQPISYGLIQVRIAEALCVLLFFSSSAVPGLFIGCFIANLIAVVYLGITTPVDLIIGSLTTLAASYLGYLLRKWPWLVPLPSVLLNAVFVGAMLHYFVIPASEGIGLFACVIYVGAGQLISCYVIGMPLLYFLRKTKIPEKYLY